MTNESNSREHHWWPVAIQSYWSTLGDVNILYPDGSTNRKKYYNRKIGKKSHGHTILRDGGPWQFNFEHEFDEADNSIPKVIGSLRREFSTKQVLTHLLRLLPKRISGSVTLSDYRRLVQLPDEFRRELTWLCASILLRSPANRFRWENYPTRFGFEASVDVGKMNILNEVRTIKKAISQASDLFLFHLVLYSEHREFIFGDGLLDSFTSSSRNGVLEGRALIPLTPHLCVYMVKPSIMKSNVNAGLMIAPPRIVDGVNEITQVYSAKELFYAKDKPKLENAFKFGEFRQFKYHKTAIVSDLEETIPGMRRPSIFAGNFTHQGYTED